MDSTSPSPVSSEMTLRQGRASLAQAITPVCGATEAAAIAQLALEHVTGYKRVDIALRAGETLDFLRADKLNAIAARLLQAEPIQYVLGHTMWMGLDLKVTPATLIPRPETSQLVDLIADRANQRPDLNVLDIGTGSGCIAIALARALKFPQVAAVDISPEALAVARDNASRLKAKVKFVEADDRCLGQALGTERKWDIIVSNPPYVMWSERGEMEKGVLDYEPQGALFVPDSDPLIHYRSIMSYASETLSRGGSIYFEFNPLQAKQLKSLAAAMLPEAEVELLPDMYARQRFAVITTQP